MRGVARMRGTRGGTDQLVLISNEYNVPCWFNATMEPPAASKARCVNLTCSVVSENAVLPVRECFAVRMSLYAFKAALGGTLRVILGGRVPFPALLAHKSCYVASAAPAALAARQAVCAGPARALRLPPLRALRAVLGSKGMGGWGGSSGRVAGRREEERRRQARDRGEAGGGWPQVQHHTGGACAGWRVPQLANPWLGFPQHARLRRAQLDHPAHDCLDSSAPPLSGLVTAGLRAAQRGLQPGGVWAGLRHINTPLPLAHLVCACSLFSSRAECELSRKQSRAQSRFKLPSQASDLDLDNPMTAYTLARQTGQGSARVCCAGGSKCLSVRAGEGSGQSTPHLATNLQLVLARDGRWDIRTLAAGLSAPRFTAGAPQRVRKPPPAPLRLALPLGRSDIAGCDKANLLGNSPSRSTTR